MSEDSVIIRSNVEGRGLAVTEAVELDASGLTRYMERVTFGSGKVTSPRSINPLRTLTSTVATLNSGESFNLSNLPSELTTNLIHVGDKSQLIVDVEQSFYSSSVIITPIKFASGETLAVEGILESKLMVQPYPFRRGNLTGNLLLPAESWDVQGCHKLGIHITFQSGSGNVVQVWADVI